MNQGVSFSNNLNMVFNEPFKKQIWLRISVSMILCMIINIRPKWNPSLFFLHKGWSLNLNSSDSHIFPRMWQEGCSLEPSEVSLKNFNDFIFILTLEGWEEWDQIGGTKIHGGYVGATKSSFIGQDFRDLHFVFVFGVEIVMKMQFRSIACHHLDSFYQFAGWTCSNRMVMCVFSRALRGSLMNMKPLVGCFTQVVLLPH